MATYTTSAPVAGVDKKYKGSFGAGGGVKYSVVPSASGRKAILCLLTGVGAYTTGGDALTMADLPLKQVHAAYVVADDSASHTQAANTAFVANFVLTDPYLPLVKWYSAAATQLANATSVAGRTLLVRLEGV